MKTLYLFLVLCPMLIFSNDKKIPSKITAVTVYLSGANITRVAECKLPYGTSEITLTGLSTKIDESSIQISGLQSVSILSMSYDINFMAAIEDETVVLPLQKRLDSTGMEIALLKNLIAGLEEEEQVIYANRSVSGRTADLSLERMKEVSTYYRQRITAIKNEIFKANLLITTLNEVSRTLQKQMSELNTTPEKEQGEIKIKFDAPIASALSLVISYQVQDAGWIPNYDIKSEDSNTPLSLGYKAYVYQKTGNDWNDVNITLSTGNPSLNASKPNLGTKYLNFTNGYQNRSIDVTQKNRYVYNPTVKHVTGTVVDESGAPLPGASIMIKNAANGTQTDFNGYFSIKVPTGQEVVVSYIGFKTTELPIYSSVMNISLEEDATALNEVVVVGYGGKNNSSLSGAVSSVSAEQVLQGKAAGIQVNNASGIRIRGAASVSRPQTPVYVVDGLIAEDFEDGDLDHSEIQSLELLKGERASALYGSRGANGVIVITTKKSTAQEAITTTKFIIKKPYSITSDGDITAIEINTFKLGSTYEYFAAPIVNENVFLTASFTNWEQYNLLPGEASIYFKGTYAGKTSIDPYTTKKEITVSLGIDQNITVTRKQNKDFKQKSFTGSNRILERKYDLDIKNNKAIAIALRLMDRIPISQDNAIKVDHIETHDANYENEKGILTWKLQLKPSETQKKSFSFQVKYPRDKSVSL